MDNQTGPKGFLVVRPGEIIEIPQDSDRSWLTPFYSLPKELAKKWEPGMKFEQNGSGFQNIYNIPQGVEVLWLTYQQFSDLVGDVTIW